MKNILKCCMITHFIRTNINKLIIQTILIFCFIKLRFKRKINSDLPYSNEIINELLKNFKPKEISHNETLKPLLTFPSEYMISKNHIDLCTKDYFNLSNKNKSKLKKIIRLYGIGTCGPPGFYGTLDLHVKLERILAYLLNKTSCILYSNLFTSINSVISCFVAQTDTIFFHSEVTEAILRGIYTTKAQSIKFTNLKNLENLLKKYAKGRYFVILSDEILGKLINLKRLSKLKETYNFHLIMDLSETFPINLNEFRNYDCVDILIGSFQSLNSCGSFVCGPSFQRLMSPSFCFSASLPAFLVGNVIINLQRLLVFPKYKLKFIQNFIKSSLNKNELSYILLPSDLPFIFIQKRDLREYNTEYKKLLKIKEDLLKEGFLIQILRNPIPRILISLKINLKKENLEKFTEIFINFLN